MCQPLFDFVYHRLVFLAGIWWICSASSWVGAMTRARARRSGPLVSLCRIGKGKAAVLPVPVCASPNTSRPASTSGMACYGITVLAVVVLSILCDTV